MKGIKDYNEFLLITFHSLEFAFWNVDYFPTQKLVRILDLHLM